jgi:hypothetical protein
MVFTIGSDYPTRDNRGIFVNNATVRVVTDLSQQPLPFIGKSFDLAIKVVLDIGRAFDKEVMIFGNFKRSPEGTVLGLGSSFKVCRFFECFGIKGELTSDNGIPPEWLSIPVGMQCAILDYRVGVKENGKNKYFTWDMIGADSELLLAEFLKNVSRGYPRNYQPSSVGEIAGVPTDGQALEVPYEELSF